ncbi:hypothetical protein BDV39DRAFT_174010 [Aspergillus sergii]|uniref:Uncharacterized protein n=1 Tax=Aspergillus sergii TaxID=1034303 RepID=A0A5N6X6H6_9EURO|nr:hypothetical protein BDV39DRAFT_174010 [Aspergillus sergii]
MIQFLADCCNHVRDVYHSCYREHIKWKANNSWAYWTNSKILELFLVNLASALD